MNNNPSKTIHKQHCFVQFTILLHLKRSFIFLPAKPGSKKIFNLNTFNYLVSIVEINKRLSKWYCRRIVFRLLVKKKVVVFNTVHLFMFDGLLLSF